MREKVETGREAGLVGLIVLGGAGVRGDGCALALSTLKMLCVVGSFFRVCMFRCGGYKTGAV